ncbi:SecDF P1 head subdomain-containing protein [Streptomyces europaeiscabiei]|uniref:SecDF P1 head subdomain-containing protein n=1 Tax=Streptomyces europaeiscabiei TaxID=146819 RepID=UPI0038F719FA
MRRRAFGLAVCLVGLVCGCGGSGDGKGGDAKVAGSDRPRTTAVASPSPSASASGSSGAGRAFVTFTSAEPASPVTLERAAELMRDRARDAGLTGVEVTVEEEKQITVAGPAGRQKSLESLGAPAELAFRPVLNQVPTEDKGTCRAVVDASPAQPLTACGELQDALYTYDLGPVALPGTDVSDAEADIDQARGPGWFVTLDFTSAGSKKFADVTGRLARQTSPQNQFAIVLDGTVLSAPFVSTAITGGKAEISGSFTRQEAEELAANLDTGALPVRLTVSSVTTLPAG